MLCTEDLVLKHLRQEWRKRFERSFLLCLQFVLKLVKGGWIFCPLLEERLDLCVSVFPDSPVRMLSLLGEREFAQLFTVDLR